jgi:hypothetical protein
MNKFGGLFLMVILVHLAHAGTAVNYVPGSSQKICQLIGETDVETHLPTLNQTETEAGIVGADLGFSFIHNGEMVFLFGDTNAVAGLVRDHDSDSIATWNQVLSPEGCIKLDFIKDPKDGGYHPPFIPGIPNSTFDVPAGGVSANGKMYVYFTTDSTPQKTMGRSVVGVSTDNGFSFSRVYDFSNNHFINIAPVKDVKYGIFYFGSGNFRASSPYLATSPEKDVENKSALKFFKGLDWLHHPKWTTNERDAVALFDQPCIGELSVAYDAPIKKWIMLYNCNSAGIEMRTADAAWGPWSDSEIIFEPVRDGAIGKFVGPDVPKDGGVYGPYMIPSLFTAQTIYYTMSTLAPYAAILMKTDLKISSSTK